MPDGAGSSAALDDQSAFVASLGASRSPRMRDVLGTIQADQDAIVRAGSRGALVVDGGPGTGKTVVALHRAAYLLYADPHVGGGHESGNGGGRGGVLVVGPSRPYLAYVADVLPGLGEEGVQTCTLRDLVPEGATARAEADPEVARLKASAGLVAAIEPAVRFSERPPAEGMEVETPWADVWLSTAEWTEAFESVDPGTPHNEARDDVWGALVEILVDKACGEPRRTASTSRPTTCAAPCAPTAGSAPRSTARGPSWSRRTSSPTCGPCPPTCGCARRRSRPSRCARSSARTRTRGRRRTSRCSTPRAVGSATRRRRAGAAATRPPSRRSARAWTTSSTTSSRPTTASSGSCRCCAARTCATRSWTTARVVATPDRLAGPFAHVVVDEAQELTDAEWQMVLSRCPSRSLTVVGDRAQARHGFPESWRERLARVGFARVEEASLSVNYRTPREIMAEAEPVVRAALPDANVPTSVRSTGVPVTHGPVADLDAVLDAWLAEHADGTACVIGATEPSGDGSDGRVGDGSDGKVGDVGDEGGGSARVRWLTPEAAKGLEFDLVVLVDPRAFGDGVEGAVDRYVAMTRATQRLVVLED